MLYSIGKDSSVLLRLAQKAFFPRAIPFPLLHVDTTYKFKEDDRVRDWYARELGLRLIVHTNTEAIADGTQPFLVGTQRCCGLLKTKSLLDALEAGSFDAPSAARARRRALAGQGADLLAARSEGPVGSEEPAPGALEPPERPHPHGRERARVPALELDRARRLELHQGREHPDRVRSTLRKEREVWSAATRC